MVSGGLTSLGGELTSLVAMVVSGGLTSRVAAVITEGLTSLGGELTSLVAVVVSGGLTSLGGELTSLVAVVIMQVDTEGTVAKATAGESTFFIAVVKAFMFVAGGLTLFEIHGLLFRNVRGGRLYLL